ncbi:MAG: hypothetical protein Q8927_19715 [Bacteroidota bacterium]|nr:hypothetical protein [Bacteroidota bacterium]MDP4218432.1 hypothetical protein [Bacteroidota bacterium]MDP4259645.1 hypothetical protein [Bacteroidota bacterium]
MPENLIQRSRAGRIPLFITIGSLWIAACCLGLSAGAQTKEKVQSPAGIVYGPKGAYMIEAPKHWVLDNKSGVPDGLPCVLYIDGFTWESSPVIMYAKIASPTYPTIDKFIAFAIREFVKEDPKFYHKELKTGEIGGKKYVIMNYRGGPYNSYERVFYVQMESAVGYVVFSAKNKPDFDKYADALLDVVASYHYVGKTNMPATHLSARD